MKISLEVYVNERQFSAGAIVEVPPMFIECFERIDVCDDKDMAWSVGGVYRGDAKMQRVVKMREDAAKILADELARMIVRQMEKRDTENGY